MKAFIATLAALLLILAGLVSSASAQTYDAVVLPLSLTFAQSVTVVSANGISYTVTCEAAFCQAGDTIAVDGTMPSYGLTYGSVVSLAPVVSYSAVSEPYSAVYGIPEPYAVPVVAVGGSYGSHGAFGHNSGHGDGGSGHHHHS